MTCLRCGYEFDTHTPTHGTDIPKPGDLSVCIRCGHLATFTDTLNLRDLTPAEHDEAMTDDNLVRVLAARQYVIDLGIA